MAVVELFPKEYGYVVIVLVLYCLLNLWMCFRVNKASERYAGAENKVDKLFKRRGNQGLGEHVAELFIMIFIIGAFKNPLVSTTVGIMCVVFRDLVCCHKVEAKAKAENRAKLLNRFKTAHQNFLDCTPVFFLLMVLGGIRHPSMSASFGAIYTVSWYFYFTGLSGYGTSDSTAGKYDFLIVFGLKVCQISCALAIFALMPCAISGAIKLLT